jgi:hypothetical protein
MRMKCEHHTRDLKILARGVRWCSRCGALECRNRFPGKVGSEWEHPTHVEFTDKYRVQPWATKDAA